MSRRPRVITTEVIGAVVRRPDLWPTAFGQLRRLAPERWWRRPPFLPLPPPDYAAFRALTQYGDAHHPPVPHDVLNYLAWCRAWQRRKAAGGR